MPRKTDGIEFDIHPSPKKGEDGKPLLYVRPSNEKKLDKAQFLSKIQKYHPLIAEAIEPVLTAVVDDLARLMSEGYRVDTPLGSFAPKLKLVGDHTDPKTVSGRDVFYDGIDYTPTRDFVKAAGQNKLGFRKSNNVVGNSQMYDERAMSEALRKSLGLGFVTINAFCYHSGLKRDSAKHYLDSLCKGEQPRLRKVIVGRMLQYYPVSDTKKE